MNPNDVVNQTLCKVIDFLEEEPRASIVRLYYQDRRSIASIAEEIGIPEYTVENHIKLFDLQLKAFLTPNEEDRPWTLVYYVNSKI